MQKYDSSLYAGVLWEGPRGAFRCEDAILFCMPAYLPERAYQEAPWRGY